jgi:hypothetical protein|tara:strand:+ start:235 stop:384 length:150 start_codon:yes stop_codon:yes gene_type:complete
MNFIKNLMPSFLYSLMMTGIMLDGNPGGALRAIKDAEAWKEDIEKISKK